MVPLAKINVPGPKFGGTVLMGFAVLLLVEEMIEVVVTGCCDEFAISFCFN